MDNTTNDLPSKLDHSTHKIEEALQNYDDATEDLIIQITKRL